MAEREGQGTRLSPLPLAQLCRSLLLAPSQILSAGGSPDYCADVLRCTPSATLRSCAWKEFQNLCDGRRQAPGNAAGTQRH